MGDKAPKSKKMRNLRIQIIQFLILANLIDIIKCNMLDFQCKSYSCTNTDKGFTCTCNDGDGDSCTEKDPTDPATYNLPSDYVYSDNDWGKFFYKKLSRTMRWDTAKSTCAQDGAALPVPRNSVQNTFWANLFGRNRDLWLGINDKNHEGKYVDNDGKPLTWKYFYWNEPNNCGGYPCRDEDAVHIFGSWSQAWPRWNDAEIRLQKNVACVYYLDLE